MKNALQYLHEILTLLDNDRRKLPTMVALFLGISMLDLIGLGLVVPYITLVIQPDSIMEGRLGEILILLDFSINQDELLLWLSLFLVILFPAKTVAVLGVNNLIILFVQQSMVRFRSNLMKIYQQLPYPIYLQRNSAEYVHSIQTLTANFHGGVLQNLLKTTSDAIAALVIILLLAWENFYVLASLLLLLSSAVIIYDYLLRSRMNEYGKMSNIANQKMIQGLHEGIEGLKEIRILGKEEFFHKMMASGAVKISYYSSKHQLIQLIPRYLLESLLIVFIIFLVLLSLYFGEPTHTLLGTLGVFGLASLRLMPMASQFAATLTNLRFQRDTVNRLYNEVRNFTPLTSIKNSLPILGSKFKSLYLSEISYRYPNARTNALELLNLEIIAGESIGIIGSSGSGKTTLIDVLLGLLEPQSGSLIFNGRPLHEALNDWRSQVAYLPQQVSLIDNTLKHNVALGEEDQGIEEERLHQALHQARLAELVEQLPRGVDTMLGERGVRLSGGQRQRVALARAFYHGRSVLVMDEATSALDNETEKEIVAEIQRLKGQKTMIVIAHRLTTVQHCDRIYRLEQGRIVEEGTPDKMLKLPKAD